jgi:hypothetical protein
MTTTDVQQLKIVTTGSYSDLEVFCVCPDEATADAVASAVDGAVGTVDMVQSVDELHRRDTLNVNVSISDAGEIVEESEWQYSTYDTGAIAATPLSWTLHSRMLTLPGHPSIAVLGLTVVGSDHERVRKVAGEVKARLMTDDAWRAEVFDLRSVYSAADDPGGYRMRNSDVIRRVVV